jgi:Tfp pilus assembly protein PilE
MGQQQLLLIVLGVIVVGIAVVVGINLFNANAVSSNRDAVVSDLNNLGAMAQQHYKKPASMGGGANAFNTANSGTAWTIPTQLDTTANGTYTATVNAQSVVIVGTGTEKGNNGTTNVQATATVTPTAVTVVINN